MKNANNKELLDAIQAIVSLAEKMKYSYFFSPPGNSRARRNYAAVRTAEKVEWTEGGNAYTARFVTSCSASHVYAHGIYTRNGKRKTLTAIRNSLRRMQDELA